ncbi:MAG TPA: hypothetical protein VI298_09030 [Geobacteraceae bacterium]
MTNAIGNPSRRTIVCVCLAAMLVCFTWLRVSPAHAGESKEGVLATSLIKEVIAAYGGEEALARITSVYTKGSIEAFMRGDKGVSTRYFKRPRKLRAELVYQHSSETRILNGFRGWRGSNGELAEVHGPPYLAMAYQYKYLDLPFGFLDAGYKITYLGRGSLRGVPVETLQLLDNEGTVMRVSIDAGTHLIARVVGAFGFGGREVELAAEFSDYRAVGGVKFPFRVTNYSGENKIAEIAVTDLRANQEMPDSVFQP